MLDILLSILSGFLIICFITDPAFGYIDPGTGSVVFSALGYLLATAAAFFAIFLRPLKSFIKKLFKKGGDPSSLNSDDTK